MKRLFIVLALFVLHGSTLEGQQTATGFVVATCGTDVYSAGAVRYPTMDTKGGFCGGSGTPIVTSGLVAVAQTVSATPKILDSYQCTNEDTVWAYVQVFDAAVPVLGTTVAKQSYGIPPGGGSIGPIRPLAFAVAITVAATTTSTGAVGVAAGKVNCNWGTK